MKSKKNIKKSVLKNKYVGLIVVVLLAVFAVVGVTKILGREVSVVCEDKKGNLFVPRDNNGKIDGCGKHGDAITFNFGDETNNGGNGSLMGSGDVAFISGGRLLDKNGRVWLTDGRGGVIEDTTQKLPSTIAVTNILQWTDNFLITKNGDLYIFVRSDSDFSWKLIESLPTPTL